MTPVTPLLGGLDGPLGARRDRGGTGGAQCIAARARPGHSDARRGTRTAEVTRARPPPPPSPSQLTWDLATPLTAAVLLCAAECYFSVKEQAKLDARAKEKLQRVQWRAGVLPRRAAGKDRGGGKGGKGGSA